MALFKKVMKPQEKKRRDKKKQENKWERGCLDFLVR